MMAGAAVVRQPHAASASRCAPPQQNPQVAGLMGVDINRIIAFTFVIGSALGAVAGVMVGSITASRTTSWASCSD